MEVFNDLKTTLLLTKIVILRTKLLGIATIMQIAFNSIVIGLIIRNGSNKNILWCLIASLLIVFTIILIYKYMVKIIKECYVYLEETGIYPKK